MPLTPPEPSWDEFVLPVRIVVALFVCLVDFASYLAHATDTHCRVGCPTFIKHTTPCCLWRNSLRCGGTSLDLVTKALVEKRHAYGLVKNRREWNAPLMIQALRNALQTAETLVLPISIWACFENNKSNWISIHGQWWLGHGGTADGRVDAAGFTDGAASTVPETRSAPPFRPRESVGRDGLPTASAGYWHDRQYVTPRELLG